MYLFIYLFIHSFIHSFIHLHAVSIAWIVSFSVYYRKQSYQTENDPIIRPILAILTSYRVYLVNQIKNIWPKSSSSQNIRAVCHVIFLTQ